MLVKRVEMSQTAAAFGDDKLLIFLFIGIGLENYYFSLFDQNCYSTTSPVHNKATGKASAFVYLLVVVVVVVVVATRMRCVALSCACESPVSRDFSLGDTCPTVVSHD
ncbi:hypothetical protein T11_844 [Trichinella zimbabwensis]|uniref:Uncharacterized protein n=1 Tax=Trichinella zimbabwensis TaxID=268475 RepID=A0A0V1HIQ9_9BILA|nr:hypothetical protein T11_844 [Trichinella zimbabwensis]